MLVDQYVLIAGTSRFQEKRSDWQVAQCLARLGHSVFPVEYNNVPDLLAAINDKQPDIVFNLTQLAHGDRRMDVHLCALFELIGIPYTGAGPRGLMLGRDKAVSKFIAERAGFRVPSFFVVGPGSLDIPRDLGLPIVVKPRFGDASEGVSAASLVFTRRQLVGRIRHLRRAGCDDVICEEYVDGRELFAGVVHDRMVHPKEFLFNRTSRRAPRLATTAFKYDKKYQKRWAIRAELADLSASQFADLERLVHATSVALEVGDYGRFDVRLTPGGDWVFLEANPNPGLGPPDKNWAGTWDSVDYDAMIQAILDSAIARARRRGR